MTIEPYRAIATCLTSEPKGTIATVQENEPKRMMATHTASETGTVTVAAIMIEPDIQMATCRQNAHEKRGREKKGSSLK